MNDVRILLPYPPAPNVLFLKSPVGRSKKQRETLRTEQFSRWLRNAATLLAAQRPQHLPHTVPVKVAIEVRRPNESRFRYDFGSRRVQVLTLLVETGIIDERSHVEVEEVRVSGAGAPCTVTVRSAV